MKKIVILALFTTVLIAACISQTRQEPVPDFSQYPAGSERKMEFFDYFLPLFQTENAQIFDERATVMALQKKSDNLYWWNERTLSELTRKYRMDEFDPSKASSWKALLSRVDKVPASLALAQGANESAWGTSRFAKDGNNFFGQWCYIAGCGLVPSKRNAGASHEVAKFDSAQESVASYLLNLNSHPAYTELRTIRAALRAKDKPVSGEALAAGLQKYSERGSAYVNELRSMIKQNDLAQYDE